MTTTKSQQVAADIAALLRARCSLLWVITREEDRAERYIAEAAAAASYTARTWDIGAGFLELTGKRNDRLPPAQDPGEALAFIVNRSEFSGQAAERCVWIMRDLPAWIVGPQNALTQRQLRNAARALPKTPRESAQAIVILTPSAEVPAELAGHATVIDWPLPDRAEIAAILDAQLGNLTDELRAQAITADTRESAIDAAIGLSGEEAASCYARSLVTLRRIDPATVAKDKKRVVARERVLEWYDPIPGGLDAVGGLDVLKSWLVARAGAYSPAARAYGLPAPKGVLLVGVPGGGKSLSAKAIATAWEVPLLRLDLGALRSKFVGESESNLRKVFAVVAAIGRCVVWVDEIEKALAGATDGGSDGGVSKDALGALLNWMQERAGEAFVIATANDVSGLPPELLRKGRFDEVFFVDLPNPLERAAVVGAALRAHYRDDADVDAATVAQVTEGFTGAEIAALVPDALYSAFADGARQITTADLVTAARSVVPLSKTAAEKITALRQWAKGRARPASTQPNEEATTASQGRALDL